MKKISDLRVNTTVFLTSLTLLCYEVILIRIYTILQWQNFFSIIVSMAMLGFGISGSILFLLKRKIDRDYNLWLQISLILYPLTLFTGFIITSRVPFNPFLLGHEYLQILYLIIYLFCMIIPFLFGASVFGILIQKYNIRRLYFMNLFGAGFGSLIVISLLFFFHPFQCLAVITGISMITAVIYSLSFSRRVISVTVTVSVIFTSFTILSFDWLELNNVSEFKSISQTLAMKNSSVLYERFSPAGLVQVVEADGLRNLAGLSIVSEDEVPEQKAIFFDGEGMSVINPYNDQASLDFIASTASAVSYHLNRNVESVLIPGSGGGEGILRALYYKSNRVDAVELNPQVIDLMRNELADYSGYIYNHPDVNIYKTDIRSYLGSTVDKYNLIDLTFSDSFASVASGVNALKESYLYTIESLESMLKILDTGGFISITRWLNDPPRDNIKLFATAVDALRRRGINTPEHNLAAIRSLQTFTLIISNMPFLNNEIESFKTFAAENLFDIVYYPGIEQEEVNRFISLEKPFFYDAAIQLLSVNSDKFIQSHPFSIKPATDDNPYFHNFFKLKTLQHIKKYGIHWFPVTEWGYLVLVFVLLIVLVLSFTGILLPLKLLSKQFFSGSGSRAIYFALIGLSYFFVEISIIQKFVLYIGLPVYSASIVISGLLVFSGLGSYFSGRIFKEPYRVLISTIIIALILLTYTLLADKLTELTVGWDVRVKGIVILLYLFPLGFFMGIPFPQVLTSIKRTQPVIIPWVWGINGFFSVISIIIASLLSIIFGYNFVILLAVITYLTAGFISIRFSIKDV